MPEPAERTALYRLYDTDGRLAYVGIAKDPAGRWKQHARYSEWWPKVTNKAVTWFDSRDGAEHAEKAAIKTEGPLYNRTHVPCIGALREGEAIRDAWPLYELDRQRSRLLYTREAQTHRPLFALAAEALREDIIEKRLRPGDRLPTYHQLRERFGTSIGPILNAIEMLEEEGWVERRDGRRGAYVCAVEVPINDPEAAAVILRSRLDQTAFAALVAELTSRERPKSQGAV